MGRLVQCYRCKDKENKIDKDIAKVEISGGNKPVNRYFHPKCYEEYNEARKERKELDKVCDYLKEEILGYDKQQAIDSRIVQRIQGIRSGQHLPSKNSKVYFSENGYDYDTILLTFKVKKPDILYALGSTRFKNEQHKMDYIIVIIQNSINDVYIRRKEKVESDKRVDEIKINFDDEKYRYEKSDKKENKVADKLKHLW